jgi:hypothetical protein
MSTNMDVMTQLKNVIMVTHVESSQILIMRYLNENGGYSEFKWQDGSHKAVCESVSDITNVLSDLLSQITGKRFIMDRHNSTTMNWVREDFFGNWYKPEQDQAQL